MADPEPSVYFLDLGDSSLNFDVRVYVKDINDWLPVTHDLHMGLVKALRENGIEIPYPQRDIHVRSVADASGREIFSMEAQETEKPPVRGVP